MKKTVNYLNNRDLISEILKSKNTFSSFRTEEDKIYDYIVGSIAEIPQVIEQAKLSRARRLLQGGFGDNENMPKRFSESEIAEYALNIKNTDIVFRVMTKDHIPHEFVQVASETIKANGKEKAKHKKTKQSKTVFDELFNITIDDTEEVPDVFDENNHRLGNKFSRNTASDKSSEQLNDNLDVEEIFEVFDSELDDILESDDIEYRRTRVNFPPFQHFRLDENNVPICVGKSHWKGDLETGEFCQTHGKITNELAKMYMELVYKYSTRANWRNYTYVEEMRSHALTHLCYAGLNFDESKSLNPFAYLTMLVHNSFLRVLSVEKRIQSIRDDILEINGMTPSLGRQMSEYKQPE